MPRPKKATKVFASKTSDDKQGKSNIRKPVRKDSSNQVSRHKSGPFEESGANTSVENHSALLADPRFSESTDTEQKARLMSTIQQHYGNSHVQRIMNRIQSDREGMRRAGQKSPEQTYGSLNADKVLNVAQDHVGAKEAGHGQQLSIAIQRQKTSSKSTVATKFGPYAPETYNSLYNITSALVKGLRRSMEEIPENAMVRVKAEEWIKGVEAWQPWMLLRADQPLGGFVASQAPVWYKDLQKIRKQIDAYKIRVITENLAGAQKDLAKASKRVQDMGPDCKEAMRAAFLKGDSNAMAEVSNFVGNVLDIGLDLNELSKKMADALGGARLGKIPEASRYTEVLTKINKVLAAVNLLYSLANVEAPTELGTAFNGIGTLAEAFSAGGTLVGLAPHIGLYANLYLVPLTLIITKQLSAILTKHLHELNIVTVAIGGKPEMSSAPGGQAMFDFMVYVMHAESPEDLPSVPSKVRKYLLKQRKLIQAGAKSEMPTKGWWFWRDLKPGEIKPWIYEQRENLWAMFYGSMPVASIKQTSKGKGTR